MTSRPTRTEAEARKCWCPLVGLSANERYTELNGTPPAGNAPPTCVGSQCMVWCWSQDEYETTRDRESQEKPEEWMKHCSDGVTILWRRSRGASRRGVCGHGTV